MSNYNSNLQTNNADLQAILDTINALPDASEGVELPELTNPGTAADLLAGKELIDADGNIITGTATYNALYIGLAKPIDSFGNDGDIFILAIGGQA